eukprot:CAMPEP_0173427904 /NCGR_PEP_ID=MMETSP1357-20121228/6983_1 /TAXON_ID=77926 /ORGANISM="Hemiselmis rufescens, Strain PCC563" /LENGTH=239 /DNA_ID=CAMNT_0014391827 /DNA_START=199 /DNA_END=915 /DNA_ORIENTATION=-
MSLKGHRVLVTGAGKGIGRAIATIFAEQGADVAVVARTEADVNSVAAEMRDKFGTKAIALACDVTSEQQVRDAVAKAVAELGSIDILVNNAGMGCPKLDFQDHDAAAFRSLLDLNVVSVMLVTSAVLKTGGMLAATDRKRNIINISSKAGKQGLPKILPYVASKFALEGMTAGMALELKEAGIRVNSISPGMVDTAGFPKAPGRAGVRTPESISEGLLLLATGDMTGSYLHVDELDAAA